MTGASSDNQHDGRLQLDDAELLISRIVDGEVSDAERSQFEQLASKDVSLWRTLVQRQQDMLQLSQDVDDEFSEAFRSNVLRAGALLSTSMREAKRQQRLKMIELSGWAAAVLITAISFVFFATLPKSGHEQSVPVVPTIGAEERLSPEQHLRRYLTSPFVVGELDPIMLQLETTPEGTLELRILRRIEEAYLLNPEDELPVDADGRLIRDPAELQRRSR